MLVVGILLFIGGLVSLIFGITFLNAGIRTNQGLLNGINELFGGAPLGQQDMHIGIVLITIGAVVLGVGLGLSVYWGYKKTKQSRKELSK